MTVVLKVYWRAESVADSETLSIAQKIVHWALPIVLTLVAWDLLRASETVE